MVHSGDKDLLPGDPVNFTFAFRPGLNTRSLGTRIGLGDRKGLETQLPGGNLGKVASLLLRAPMSEKRAHGVHLGMTGRGRSTAVVDLFQDQTSLGNPQTAPPVFFRDQGRKPSELG